VTFGEVYYPCIYRGHSGPLSLAFPLWVDAMSSFLALVSVIAGKETDMSEYIALGHAAILTGI